MAAGFFITGTDTNVGKTWASVALMAYLQKQGKSVLGMKPVSSGCEWVQGQLRNSDALLLQQQASFPVAYSLVNPYAYELPVSPHLAGIDRPVDFSVVLDCFNTLQACADIVVVEGAGGWFAPVNASQSICDLAITLGLPVVVVVAIRLGCINHALLTFKAIAQSGLACAGWVAVCTSPETLFIEENINKIKVDAPCPLMGVLPYLPELDVGVLAGCLSA